MAHADWWLWSPEPGVLLWARLRLREDTGAEVLDSSGLTIRFDDLDTGRHYLLGADYRAFDGLDAADAAEMGFALDAIAPPDAPEGAALVRQMTQRLR